MYGAIGGAIGGGIGASGLGNDIWGVTVKIAAAGVVGGTIAELSGGKFSQGALPAMFGAAVSIGVEMVGNSNADKGVTTDQKKSRYSLDLDLTIRLRLPDYDNLLADASGKVLPKADWKNGLPRMFKASKFSACGVKEISIVTFSWVGTHAVLNVFSYGFEAVGLGTTAEMLFTGTKLVGVADHSLNFARETAKDVLLRINRCKAKHGIE